MYKKLARNQHKNERLGRRSKRSLPGAMLMSTLGASILEFAILAPIFIFFIIYILELALAFTVQNALEAAVREAARYSITGNTYGYASRQDAIIAKIKEVAVNYSGGMIKEENLRIEVKAYGDLSDVGAPEPFDDLNRNGQRDNGEAFDDVNGNGMWDADQGVSGSYGSPGQVVLYKVSYEWQFTLPLPTNLARVTLAGQTPVENENY